jgi:hypothetical protein
VVKADDGNPETGAGMHRLPGDLIWIAALDEVWLLALQHALDCLEAKDHPITRRA